MNFNDFCNIALLYYIKTIIKENLVFLNCLFHFVAITARQNLRCVCCETWPTSRHTEEEQTFPKRQEHLWFRGKAWILFKFCIVNCRCFAVVFSKILTLSHKRSPWWPSLGLLSWYPLILDKSLQLIWRSDTSGFHQRVLDPLMSYSDLT